MRLLYGHDAEVTHWVCERVPHLKVRIPYYPPGAVLGPAVAIGVLDDGGTLIAGAVFHNHDPFCRSIEVSCAADNARWATRGVLRVLLRYVFRTAQCQRLSATTPRRATSTRRFLEGLHFKREASIRRGFGTDNAIVHGLLVEEWAAGPFGPPRSEREGLDVGKEIRPRFTAAA